MIKEYLEFLIESTSVNKDLKRYIDSRILPLYKRFDGGHNIKHALEVINFSMKLQKLIKDTDPNIVYTVAAYHDIGLKGPRETHHELSAKIVRADKNLKRWFDDVTINIIAQACSDHRASGKNPAQSIYGNIVGDADRSSSTNIEDLLIRTWEYRMGHKEFSHLSDEETFDDMYQHMVMKFGEGGYAKFTLPETRRILQKDIDRTQRILKSRDETYKLFLKMRKSGALKK